LRHQHRNGSFSHELDEFEALAMSEDYFYQKRLCRLGSEVLAEV
jgi:hypothetical protein